MQFKTTFIAAAVLCASNAMAATVTGFTDADCTGTAVSTLTLETGCAAFGSASLKSIEYSGVPNSIEFFKTGGPAASCIDAPTITRGAGSGCATAPEGFNWKNVLVA